MLVALEPPNNKRVEAKDAIKLCDYICPNCANKVIFAKGNKYRWHFKHAKGSTCSYAGETWQHEDAKSSILKGARKRGLTATPELPILSIAGDRRADVIIWAPQTNPPRHEDQRRLAFEVQYSPIDCDALEIRTQAYMAAGVPVIWIPVIDLSKLKYIQADSDQSIFLVSAYSSPVWIEYVESIHGHLWIYIPQTKFFWRGWLLDHWLYKNPSEGWDADGNHHSSGGYWFQAKRMRDLYLEGPYEFDNLRLVRKNHSNSKLISPNKERRFLVDLVPDGEGKNSLCPAEKRRKAHLVNGVDTGHYTYEDWVRVGDDWQVAGFKPSHAMRCL